MKHKIIIVEINKDGKIEFTKEDLEKLIDEVYEDGFENGKRTIYPYWPTTITPDNYNITVGDDLNSSGNSTIIR